MSLTYPMEIRLFGVLRDRFGLDSLQIEVLPELSANDIKNRILQSIQQQSIAELVSRSVLATEDRILLGAEAVGVVKSLSLLPPVCGG
jgi:hypothetical protein